MTEQQSFDDAQRRIVRLSTMPVKGRTERRERDRELDRTIMQITGGIGETYWAAKDQVSEWTAETDKLPFEEATKRYVAYSQVPDATPSDWQEPEHGISWMAERSSYPTNNREGDSE